MAVEGGHKDMVEYLVDKGADINITDQSGVSIKCIDGNVAPVTLP